MTTAIWWVVFLLSLMHAKFHESVTEATAMQTLAYRYRMQLYTRSRKTLSQLQRQQCQCLWSDLWVTMPLNFERLEHYHYQSTKTNWAVLNVIAKHWFPQDKLYSGLSKWILQHLITWSENLRLKIAPFNYKVIFSLRSCTAYPRPWSR